MAANTPTITAADVQNMVQHELTTPVFGYLGSAYGSDAASLLQNPLSATSGGEADAFIVKLMDDVPVLKSFPAGSVNLYAVGTPPDRMDIVIEVAGSVVYAGGGDR